MNSLKQSRVASFIIITIIYILAAAVGIIIYTTLPYSWWLNLLIADIVATVFTFIFSVVLNNASVYDPYWSVQPVVILFAFSLKTALDPLRILLLFAVFVWGTRLTLNWAYTFKNLYHQDWRYTMLKEKTGAFYPFINLVGIHLVPTIVVYFCTLPAAYAFVYEGRLSPRSLIFIAISLGAALLQGVADFQMHRFRKNRTSSFIRTGLWKYSRHPNYLGEILMWWGIALAVISAFPNEPQLMLGAVLNTVLFSAVSIPMADKRQSQKPDFDAYKNETRMLLPIKPLRKK